MQKRDISWNQQSLWGVSTTLSDRKFGSAEFRSCKSSIHPLPPKVITRLSCQKSLNAGLIQIQPESAANSRLCPFDEMYSLLCQHIFCVHWFAPPVLIWKIYTMKEVHRIIIRATWSTTCLNNYFLWSSVNILDLSTFAQWETFALHPGFYHNKQKILCMHLICSDSKVFGQRSAQVTCVKYIVHPMIQSLQGIKPWQYRHWLYTLTVYNSV